MAELEKENIFTLWRGFPIPVYLKPHYRCIPPLLWLFIVTWSSSMSVMPQLAAVSSARTDSASSFWDAALYKNLTIINSLCSFSDSITNKFVYYGPGAKLSQIRKMQMHSTIWYWVHFENKWKLVQTTKWQYKWRYRPEINVQWRIHHSAGNQRYLRVELIFFSH